MKRVTSVTLAALSVALLSVAPLIATAQQGGDAPQMKGDTPSGGPGAWQGRKSGDGSGRGWQGRKSGDGSGRGWQGRKSDGGSGGGSGGWQGRKGGDGVAKGQGQGKKKGGRFGPSNVVLDAVIRGPVTDTVPVYGRLVARRAGQIAAQAKGAVGEMKVDVGDRVKKNDVLAVLVLDSLKAARDVKAAEMVEMTAKIETAEAQVKLARLGLQRLTRLKKSAAFSQAVYEDKRQDVARLESTVAESKAALIQARAELRLAEIDLANAHIKAPFPGVVSQRHTEVGAYLNVGSPVVTLINDTEIEVEAEVPSARLAGLPPGAVVTGEFEDSSPFSAAVRAIVPQEDPLSRTRTVRLVANIDYGKHRIAVNQSIRLRIPVGAPRTVVSVHKDALIMRQGRRIVFVVETDRAMVRPVQIGDAVGNRFEVLSGLRPGEKVVIRGNERLRPNQQVVVTQPDAPQGDAEARRGRRPAGG